MAKRPPKQKEGNLYDKIFKENAEQIFMPLIERRLKVKIKHFSPLQEKFQTTIEREMDFFYEFDYSAIKIINNMTLGYDVANDYLFNKGIAEGREKGIEEGIEKGTALGEEKGKKLKTIQAIMNMHKKDFEPALIAEILNEEVKFVKQIQKELKLATKITKALAVKYARINSIAKQLKVNPLLVRAIKELAKAKKKNDK